MPALESTAERGESFVAYEVCDGLDLLVRIAQHLSGTRYSPSRQILQRWLAHQLREARAKGGTRHVHALRERHDRPRFSDTRVYQVQGLVDARVRERGNGGPSWRSTAPDVGALADSTTRGGIF